MESETIEETAEGCVVHAWYDGKRKLIQILGRLADGRSFAAGVTPPGTAAGIDREQGRFLRELLDRSAPCGNGASKPAVRLEDRGFRLFDAKPCLNIEADSQRDFERALSVAKQHRIAVADLGLKGAQEALVQLGIRYGVRVSGTVRAGRRVDAVFTQAAVESAHSVRPALSVLSLDIETEEPSGRIRCISLAMRTVPPKGRAEEMPGADPGAEPAGDMPPAENRALVFAGTWPEGLAVPPWISVQEDERLLLLEASRLIAQYDPDILTGWNVIDFDFLRLAAACERCRVPFDFGRSVESGKYFPAESSGGRARSASVFLPGRQVLDALRLVRTGWDRYDSYGLETVAQAVLGRGKTEVADGRNKLAELDRLYAEDPLSFCEYCMNDAVLVLDILDRKELIQHTAERAALTGAGLDKAWTSVASFERIYAELLFARRIFPPGFETGRKVSGAAGGTVLEPASGMFGAVAVFDFRSLYPSLMRTFNIDPHAYERALRSDSASEETIIAPNGAAFVRERGVLPRLIDDWFEARVAAISRGDDGAAFVYKILMNSFYGVLGTPSCRYARTELAGAITSFGKVCLHFARDFFIARGFRVLYGDTDSVFVELGAPEPKVEALEPKVEALEAKLEALASELNRELALFVQKDWNCESHIQIRFEKLYTRFFIPRLRTAGEGDERGRSKGYAGLLAAKGGKDAEVEIKGMEAARSDYVPLARRFQTELLRLIFTGNGTGDAAEFIRQTLEKLFKGEFDAELVFKKRLVRVPESYIANVPPHIKVARSLGWKNRRGTVEYVMTTNGAEALSLQTSPIDYLWYAQSQLLPLSRSAGAAAGFDADAIFGSVHPDGQMEFEY